MAALVEWMFMVSGLNQFIVSVGHHIIRGLLGYRSFCELLSLGIVVGGSLVTLIKYRYIHMWTMWQYSVIMRETLYGCWAAFQIPAGSSAQVFMIELLM